MSSGGVNIFGTKICQKMVFKYLSPKNSKKSASGSFFVGFSAFFVVLFRASLEWVKCKVFSKKSVSGWAVQAIFCVMRDQQDFAGPQLEI